ncbi:MAG: NPCBM/NEW2 domain-containing protein [Verrucomicrobiales bacterium]
MKNLITSFCLALPAVCAANPSDLSFTKFSSSDLTPSPACLSASANGEVYVGVDLLGSLGKGPGKGRIVRLVDNDNDGIAEAHTIYANIDNPRGLIAMGDKLYVLHTIIPADTGKLTGMDLSVLEDKDRDGIADGPPKTLIKNISVAKHNQDRGADHTTNGVRMGIDGWIYIAVGDFGFVDAEGRDGTKLTMLGGGVLRVRPDGTDMEVYTHGTRNIYDVAIDPFMNIYTRGNTNDGGGWNVRFIHHIQSGEYGYPVLFKNFTEEILPALQDLGGGSGTGALFLDEPNWPVKYNKQPMMADWGRNQIFIHRLTRDGPSFKQKAEEFIGLSQPSDLDVDGSSRLYIAAWEGAGYKGNPARGFVQRVVPQGWTYKPFPDLTILAADALVKGLDTASATTRLAVQQEILTRGDKALAEAVLATAKDTTKPVENRVAALFTYKQLLGKDAQPALLELAKDKTLEEFALRALSDRLSELAGLSTEPFIAALKYGSPRVKVAAAVSLGRIGDKKAADVLLSVSDSPGPPKEAFAASTPPLFDSGVITGEKSAEIDISLTGVTNLCLVVEDMSKGKSGGHAGWFDPMLTKADGTQVPLAYLNWKSAIQDKGIPAINQAPDGYPLARADGKPHKLGIGIHPRSVIHYVLPAGTQRFTATVGLCATKSEDAAISFKVLSEPPGGKKPAGEFHALPNSPIIVPHVAVHALVRLKAVDACLAALDGPNRSGALWALKLMHEPAVVDGLLSTLASTTDAQMKVDILGVLARLYTREAPYDGSWWWGTQPDTRGPYYKPIKWEKSPAIETAIREAFDAADLAGQEQLTAIANLNRMGLEGISSVEQVAGKKEKTIGETSIENVMLALDKMKGNPKKGAELMKTQACIACHSMGAADPKRGPDLNHIGARLDREAIAEAILKPDAGISPSWVDVTLKDGNVVQGTLVEKGATEVIIRDIAGTNTTLKAADVASIKTSASTLMTPHLMDTLTMREFADVIAYLNSLK